VVVPEGCNLSFVLLPCSGEADAGDQAMVF